MRYLLTIIICLVFFISNASCSTYQFNKQSTQLLSKKVIDNNTTIKIEDNKKVIPIDLEGMLVVFFKDSMNPKKFAEIWTLEYKYPMKTPNAYVFKASNEALKGGLLDELKKETIIDEVFLDHEVELETHEAFFNDKYFESEQPGTNNGWHGLWHLERAKVIDAWKLGATGEGVIVGILDQGVEYEHEDLKNNYLPDNSYDFLCKLCNEYFQCPQGPTHGDWDCRGDDDPSPDFNSERHGTKVAGIGSAEANNQIGTAGGAFLAKFSSLRVLSVANNEVTLASSMSDAHLYKSNELVERRERIKIKNNSYGATTPYKKSAMENYAIKRSTEAGTIHVFSAGNARPNEYNREGRITSDSNKLSKLNIPESIVVAALGIDDKYSIYSSYGANVFVTAPSGTLIEGIDRFSDIIVTPQIITTTRMGLPQTIGSDLRRNYTKYFSGTSSSAPLTEAILALSKGVYEKLNTRVAKHLIVKTSDIVDREDRSETSNGGWQTNSAGNHFNPNYGFGIINAEKLVIESKKAPYVSSLITYSEKEDQDQVIESCFRSFLPLITPCPVTTTTFVINRRGFSFGGKNPPVEEVMIDLGISYSQRGLISATLISPSGTRSKVLYASRGDTSRDSIRWTFLSNAFWGEKSAGFWKLEIQADGVPYLIPNGILKQATLTVRTGKLEYVNDSGEPAQPTVDTKYLNKLHIEPKIGRPDLVKPPRLPIPHTRNK